MTELLHHHRWSAWHMTYETNREGQHLYLRMNLATLQIERTWAWPQTEEEER